MLKMRWLEAILILTLSVFSSHQQDSAPDEVPKHEVPDELSDSNQMNIFRRTYFGAPAGYYTRHDKSDTGDGLPSGIHEFLKHHSINNLVNGPKTVKVTYKKTYKVNNNKGSHDFEANNKNPTSEQIVNLGHKYLDDSTSYSTNDAELRSLLLEYLNRHKDVNKIANDFTVKVDSTNEGKHENNANGAHDLSIFKEHRRTENETELDLNKDKENKPQNYKYDVAGAIEFPDTELNSELQAKMKSHSNSFSEKITKRVDSGESGLVPNFSNVNNHERGYQDSTYQWNFNADDNGKEVSNIEKSKDLDTSQIGFRVQRLCENSKTNLLEFWKSAAKYLGLYNPNLKFDKERFDLFSAILKNMKDDKQQGTVEMLPSKPESEVYSSKVSISEEVPKSEYFKKLNWSNRPKFVRTRIQESNTNERVLYSGPNEYSLQTDGKLDLNGKQPGTETKIPLIELEDTFEDRSLSNQTPSLYTMKSENTIPDQSLKYSELPEGFITKYESMEPVEKKEMVSLNDLEDTRSFRSSNIKSAQTNPNDLPKSLESPQALASDFDVKGKPMILTNNEDLDLLESKETTSKPDLNEEKIQDVKVSNEVYVPFEINTTQLDERTPVPPTYKSKEEQKNGYYEKVLNNDSLSDYLNETVPGDKNPVNSHITKESSDSDEITLNRIGTHSDIQALSKVPDKKNLDQESVFLHLEDQEIPINSKEVNLEGLRILLQLFKNLPKDELTKIMSRFMLKNKLSPKFKFNLNFNRKNKENDNYNADNLSNMSGNRRLRPNLLLKYIIGLKNKEPTAYGGLNEYNLKSDESDSAENVLHPEPHLKTKINLADVFFKIITIFKKYGISEEALRELIGYLQVTLSLRDIVPECPAKEMNKKLSKLKNDFENLLTSSNSAKIIKVV